MRIIVTFTPIEREQIILPVNYQHILQAVILKMINDENYMKFIHDIGYKYEKRSYKLYCFSKLFGDSRYNKNTKMLHFKNEVKLVISTILPELFDYLVKSCLFEGNKIKLGFQEVKIKSIQINNTPEIKDNQEIYMLSPCSVYSTFLDEQGKRKVHYYSPKEPEFEALIKRNIIKKYIAYYNQEPENSNFSITALGNNKEIVTLYKGNYTVKAYNGNYLLKGNKDLIKLAYDVGIGAKNAHGFRMYRF